MSKLIDMIQNKDAASFKDAFEELVASKVFDALESKKLEVAQSFFTPAEVNENGGFGSTKTSGSLTKGWPAAKHSSQGLPKTKEEKKMEEAKMCPHCEMSMSKCKCDHMEEEVEQINEDGKRIKVLHPKTKKVIGTIQYTKDIKGRPGFEASYKSRWGDENSTWHPIDSSNPLKDKAASRHAAEKSVHSMHKEYTLGEEVEHKHEKKHGKMHHKLAKKMMKLAHKHSAKKHDHEEEE